MVAKRLLAWVYAALLLGGLFFVYKAWMVYSHPAVIIEWSTASELDTAGFNLYRSETLDGPYERVNQDLIPASPDPLTGGSYEYLDTDVEPGHIYYYELEDVEFNGAANRYDPILGTAERGGWLELVAALLLIGTGLYGLFSILRPPANRRVTEERGRV